MNSESDDSDEPQSVMSKRKWNGRALWTMMKRWVTGETAVMEQEDIDRELFELARQWMEVSKLKKLPCHIAKTTDVSLWKQYQDRVKKKSGIRIRSFRCPLKHRTGCGAGIRIQYGPDWMQLDRCGEHNASSHDQDRSNYLKYDQICAIADAVTVAPNLSAAQLRRNMSLADSPGKKRYFRCKLFACAFLPGACKLRRVL